MVNHENYIHHYGIHNNQIIKQQQELVDMLLKNKEEKEEETNDRQVKPRVSFLIIM